MKKVLTLKVSVFIDNENETVAENVAKKMHEENLSEQDVFDELAKLYQAGIEEILEDEINVENMAKVTVEKIND